MARCDRCGEENPNPTKFCGHCGSRFVARPPDVVAGEDGAVQCARHKKEATRVRCGRCDRPICHRCSVLSAAGVRCRDCARHKSPTRLRGMAHNAKMAIGPMDGKKVWYLYIFAMIARFFTGWFR